MFAPPESDQASYCDALSRGYSSSRFPYCIIAALTSMPLMFCVTLVATPQQIPILLLLPVANAPPSSCRACRLVCDYSSARSSMLAATR